MPLLFNRSPPSLLWLTVYLTLIFCTRFKHIVKKLKISIPNRPVPRPKFYPGFQVRQMWTEPLTARSHLNRFSQVTCKQPVFSKFKLPCDFNVWTRFCARLPVSLGKMPTLSVLEHFLSKTCQETLLAPNSRARLGSVLEVCASVL